jgi:hypothetical protein
MPEKTLRGISRKSCVAYRAFPLPRAAYRPSSVREPDACLRQRGIHICRFPSSMWAIPMVIYTV